MEKKGFQIPKRFYENKSISDPYDIEEANVKAYIANRDAHEKKLKEELKKQEESPWKLNNVISWIVMLVILLFMSWVCSSGY